MTSQHPERPWATGVLIFAGAISLSFNTVHSVGHTRLPVPLALLYGSGPVVLAAMQSHVVAIQAARGDLIDGWRKFFTFGLVVGALALSFLGIYDLLNHAVPNPIRASHVNLPAVLTPIVVDLMAIAALHELLRPASRMVVEVPATTRQAAGEGDVVADGPHGLVSTPWGGLSRTADSGPAVLDQVGPDHIIWSGSGAGDHADEGREDQTTDRTETRTKIVERVSGATQPDPGPGRDRQRETSAADRDLVAEAHAANTTYLSEHGRPISAEKLRKTLGIGKPAALDLVKEIRGTHMDVAR